MLRLLYDRTKRENPEAVVVFRVGKFMHVSGADDVSICRSVLPLPADSGKSLWDRLFPHDLAVYGRHASTFVHSRRNLCDASWPVSDHEVYRELLQKAGYLVLEVDRSSIPESPVVSEHGLSERLHKACNL
jgi:hypothetical protein